MTSASSVAVAVYCPADPQIGRLLDDTVPEFVWYSAKAVTVDAKA